MRMFERAAQVDQQAHAGAQVEAQAVRVRDDRFAIDVFHREPEIALRPDAGIDEARDARMVEARQRALLVAQGFGAQVAATLAMDQLERDRGGEPVVGAARAVDLGHAAAADQGLDAEVAERLAGGEHPAAERLEEEDAVGEHQEPEDDRQLHPARLEAVTHRVEQAEAEDPGQDPARKAEDRGEAIGDPHRHDPLGQALRALCLGAHHGRGEAAGREPDRGEDVQHEHPVHESRIHSMGSSCDSNAERRGAASGRSAR